MSDFDRCRTCGKMDWLNRHTCPPLHYVRLAEPGEEWFEVHARDEEEAAQKAAERLDEQYEDYRIASRGEEVIVEVAPCPDPEPSEVKRFAVYGEMEAVYRATPECG